MAHDPHHSPTEAPKTMLDVDKVPTLFVVYLVVLGLAAANIFLATTGLGAIALPVQLGIASVQAALVAWYWMHMRRGDTLVSLSVATTLFFMFIFFVLVLSDVLTRWRGGL
ncbi:MAG TPA: cytochrome C oxidase subunit IV family protein [Urbifossiella sp.]|jgi:cytochrome c oxidase subunit 4|nr:cytochrome C oxidase subunit IV family protein [Urbifossiella sp.]